MGTMSELKLTVFLTDESSVTITNEFLEQEVVAKVVVFFNPAVLPRDIVQGGTDELSLFLSNYVVDSLMNDKQH